MIGALAARARVFFFRRLNPGLEMGVARNDMGQALGVRAVYHHPSGRQDAMSLQLKAPRRGSDAVIIASVRGDLQRWVIDVRYSQLGQIVGSAKPFSPSAKNGSP